jgi:hypothetical protein
MYSPLDPDKRQIRLLRLLSGTGAEDIQCELYATSLDNPDEFEALSYVWGSPSDPLPIIIQQESKRVTRNLESALRHTRYPDRPRILWVDAVCINQDDVHEKSTQIQYMGLIYSEASQVLVWLGEESEHDLESVTVIRKLAADKDLHWTDETLDINLFTLHKFLGNDWWSRIWTVQEAVLAKQITYQVGELLLSDQVMINMANSHSMHISKAQCCDLDKFWTQKTHINIDLEMGNAMERLLHLVRFQANCRDRGLPFEEVAAEFRIRDATDPRDKVYGLLGISHGVSLSSVDYSLTVPQVFESATRDVLDCRGTLDVLSHCEALFSTWEHPIPSSREQATVDLPSWVPDWGAQGVSLGGSIDAVAYRMGLLSAYNACGSFPYVNERDCPPRGLNVSGLLCDMVEKVGGESREKLIIWSPGFPSEWRRLVGIDEEPSRPYIAGGTISDAFWRTFFLDISPMSGMLTHGQNRAKRATLKDHDLYKLFWYMRLLDSHSLPPAAFVEGKRGMAFQHVMRTTLRRQFFVSSKGFIGLGPPDTKVGDWICVFAGGKMPFVVRDLGGGKGKGVQGREQENQCRLLGDAYVHGLMDGEAMSEVDDPENLETFYLL